MRRVWLSNKILGEMICEAERKAPLETGGVLAGYCSADDNDLVVTNMIGPGPKATHRLSTFRPDYKHDREQILNIFEQSAGTITYLGDWHTHPGAKPYLSVLDKRALSNIARFKGNLIDRPVMLVLGCYDERKWVPEAWRAVKRSHSYFMSKYDYIGLEIIVY